MIVGLIVLVIGVGWPHLRRTVVRLLPASVQGRLPAPQVRPAIPSCLKC